jgi:hypothetical protein
MGDWDGTERRRDSRERALYDLDYHWGSACEISEGSGVWRAVRRDSGLTLIATAPEDLRLEIIRDYTAKPVVRAP